MAARAGAKPVAVDAAHGIEAVLRAVGERARVLVLCNPNDPTGTYLDSPTLAGLLRSLPDGVHVLLDEALIHFQDVEDVDACLRLTAEFPRLVCFRTFSKVYGLSGLRAGYAVGSPGLGRAARPHRAGARRERPHPVRGRPGAQDRRARGRAAAGLGDPRATPHCSSRCASCRSTPTRARPTSSGCGRTG